MTAPRPDAVPPITAVNPPFQSRLRYRAADEAEVRARVLRSLAEELPQWNAARIEYQQDPDGALVLADLIARTCELLGFYQDVHANEAFLRTASLEASLVELGALVDYRPAPGASAQSLQVFVVKAGQSGTVPAGYRIEAKHPTTGATIVFETEQALDAAASRNAMPLDGYNRSSRRLHAPGSTLRTSLRLDRGYDGLKAGSVVVAMAGSTMWVLRLSAVTVDGDTRRIHWPASGPGHLPANVDIPLADLMLHGKPAHVMRLHRATEAGELRAGAVSAMVASAGRFSVGFGALLESGPLLQPIVVTRRQQNMVTWAPPVPTSLRRAQVSLRASEPLGILHGDVARGARQVSLATTATHLPQPGDHLLLADASGAERLTITDMQRRPLSTGAVLHFTVAEPTSRALRRSPEIVASWIPGGARDDESARLPLRPITLDANTDTLVLDRAYDGLIPHQVVALDDGRHTHAARLREVSADAAGRTVLTIEPPLPLAMELASLSVFGPFAHVMRAEGYDRADELTLDGANTLVLAGHQEGIMAGMFAVIAHGAQMEGARIANVEAGGGRTTLRLARALQLRLPIGTARVSTNVVPVSHGATVAMQVLGSGDAAVPRQSFVLPRVPLTYLQDARADRGVRPAMDLFVGDERWHPVPTLADSTPTDHHYVIRTDDKGRSTITFGDGVLGARLPSGRDNVRVRYRVGMGMDGNLPSGSVTNQPQALPFVESTRNAVAAVGGATREAPAAVRESAPRCVRTLDRAVTLADHADLARSFPGIAKARADWAWTDGRRDVVVTVVTTSGAPMTPELATTLRQWLVSRRSNHQRLIIREGRPAPIHLRLRVDLRGNVLRAAVEPQVRAALNGDAEGTGFFALSRRSLGERLYLSDVYASVMGVAGVASAVATHFAPEGDRPETRLRDVIALDPAWYATGGHPTLASRGRLILDVQGGIE